MSENEFLIPKIIAKYLNGELDPEQRTALEEWLNESAANRAWFNEFSAESEIESRFRQYQSAEKELLWEITQRKIKGVTAQRDKKPNFTLLQRIGVAAAVAAIIVSAGIWFLKTNTAEKPNQQSVYANDILPGKQGATLTLANGKKIRLSDAGKGELANEAGVTISKTANGQLVYVISNGSPSSRGIEGTLGHAASRDSTGVGMTNTLSTANGETYQVKLPDGSLVYLNAASSLTYATSLMEKGKRVVRLQGEGYFEIAKDKSHPFIVKTDKQEVEVLGTHFNINAYKDEGSIRTTLLEGSVRVAFLSPKGREGIAREGRILKPNQQSVLTGSNRLIINEVDAEDAVAWKQGYFQFEGETLESIMRKVSRWYDVEVQYQDNSLKQMAFVGTVSKYKSVSQVLKKLQLTQELDFKIEGRIILISRFKK